MSSTKDKRKLHKRKSSQYDSKKNEKQTTFLNSWKAVPKAEYEKRR
ncbi:hypothetical protein LI071_01465 [Bacillus subtilis]|nr:hypothetical protein [Bacillus subtilis]MCB7159337.1 hypothetical protein [Bacillus subtilis]MCB7459665.1 hypothetical protein [Bacillus subtilis]